MISNFGFGNWDFAATRNMLLTAVVVKLSVLLTVPLHVLCSLQQLS